MGFEFDVELNKIDQRIKKKEFESPLPICIDQRGVAPVQYPDWDSDEVLGEEDIADVNEKFGADKYWEPDENCPHCKALKDNGAHLPWYPDEPERPEQRYSGTHKRKDSGK